LTSCGTNIVRDDITWVGDTSCRHPLMRTTRLRIAANYGAGRDLPRSIPLHHPGS
jgi:hypothetical protein